MRPLASFLLLTPLLLSSQAPFLDGGRLDPAWFGREVAFRKTKPISFQWIKPGLRLEGRMIRVREWDPAVWLAGPREKKDRNLVRMLESYMAADLEKGLRKGLKQAAAVSRVEGDLILLGRIVDAVGDAEDGMFSGTAGLTFDLKLMDAASGELVGAFHDTVRGLGNTAARDAFAIWCVDLGQALRGNPGPAAAVTPAPPGPLTAAPPAPPAPPASRPAPDQAFDLEGALRRLEALRRDGLLTEEEYQALRKKALEKARGQSS